MQFIELFKQQLNTTNNKELQEVYSNFMDAYYQLFSRFNNIKMSKDRLLEIIDENTNVVKSNDIIKILEFCSWLKNKIVEIEIKLNQQYNIEKIPPVVLFIGDGTIDGNGVSTKFKTYGFFEVLTLKDAINNYNIDVFLAHELIHPIHYQLNSSFFAGNWTTLEEYYFKRLYSEGIATYFSKVVTLTDIEEGYWFGILKKEEIEEWVNYCEENKVNIGIKIMKSVEKNEIDGELIKQLFQVVDRETFTKYRLAYYYGTKIVEKINERFTFEEVLKLEYKDIRYYILDYFNIS